MSELVFVGTSDAFGAGGVGEGLAAKPASGGDELAHGDADTLRGTGFLARNWHLLNRNTWLENAVEHAGKAFLGLTMNCARWHDHKFDPIPQRDYYALAGIFRAEIHGTNVSAYVDAERSSYIVTDCQEPEVYESRSFAGDLGTENPNHWLGFWHESRHFIDSVKAKRQTTASLSEAVKSWELIHKIYAASGLSV